LQPFGITATTFQHHLLARIAWSLLTATEVFVDGPAKKDTKKDNKKEIQPRTGASRTRHPFTCVCECPVHSVGFEREVVAVGSDRSEEKGKAGYWPCSLPSRRYLNAWAFWLDEFCETMDDEELKKRDPNSESFDTALQEQALNTWEEVWKTGGQPLQKWLDMGEHVEVNGKLTGAPLREAEDDPTPFLTIPTQGPPVEKVEDQPTLGEAGAMDTSM
jgi:hypothetical protein